MSAALHSGGCRCGAGARSKRSGEPLSVGYCHCSDCRRATGAPVSAFVGFRADEVSLAGETLQNVRERRGDPQLLWRLRLADRLYRPASGGAGVLHARRHGPPGQLSRRRCTPMCASSCRSCTCPTSCRAIRRPACPRPDGNRHHENHPLLAQGPSRDRRLAWRDRRAADRRSASKSRRSTTSRA